MNPKISIREATTNDHDAIWNIIKQVIASGDTYVFAPDSSREKMLAYWFSYGNFVYVAEVEGKIMGTYLFRPNQPDLGSHIANAAYMTSPSARGLGIGRAMGEHSFQEAKRHGFQAMQYNIVVKSNMAAVRLWQSLGMEIIGEIPDAFDHKQLGLTNAYVMYKKL